ncbi:NAD(P)/FAD-dependent oxidoreductase [Microbacterium sp. LMI1-1-1.1]|uniref:NAD(P)/FAD-dependent oxidoreductase n=1 Tax=Microbacterium sp. LMI1-1-1.1 TaxID=3135223 RepID=UPI0034673F45
MYDTIVLGGGPAGLQAALTLGRMHRRTLLVDSGVFRNGTVSHAHNLLTNDGRDPAELRALARAELAAYATVEIRDAAVSQVRRDGDALVVEVDGAELRARTLVLATGLHDELPPIPGLAEQWGDRVANCPFCHGHEFAGRPVAVLNADPHAQMLARMLGPVASQVLVIDPAEVSEVRRTDDGLALLRTDGTVHEVAGAFAAPVSRQRAPFAEQLGLEISESGGVRTDAFGRTSAPDVYAAGDMAHPAHLPGPMASLAAAIASGQLAAVAVVQFFAAEEVTAA